jgi:type II secretory pathway component PulF
MSTYIYEAYDKENKIIHGEHEASSQEEVVEFLARRSLKPVSIKILSAAKQGKGILAIQLFESVNSIDILFFIRNLSITIKAGLPIVESLEILIKDAKKKVMKKILQGAQSVIQNGQPLSRGFDAFKDLFPPIFIGMIKAGEVSGQLDKTLTELARNLSKEYALRSKVKSALTYPVILLVASVLVVALMLIFVLPRLTKSFAQSGVSLPWITKVFLFISQILTWSFVLDIAVAIGLVWFFLYFRKTRIGKRFFFYILSRIPVARDLIKKIALVRFSRTLGNLIGSGLSVGESLEISSQSINNQIYTVAIKQTIEDIGNGISISESLAKSPKLFPSLFVSLVSVGERTGSLQEILLDFSSFYEEEVDNELKELTSVLEPVLLLVMGLMIGSIAISIILPIYQLVGHFV